MTLWNRIINRGTEKCVYEEDKRKVRILNSACIKTVFIFLPIIIVQNIILKDFEEVFLVIGFCTMLSIGLIINQRGNNQLASIILLGFTTIGIFLIFKINEVQTAAPFAFVLIAFASSALLGNRILKIGFIVFNLLLSFLVHLYQVKYLPFMMEENWPIILIMIILGFGFYFNDNENIKYQKGLRDKNNKLEEQRRIIEESRKTIIKKNEELKELNAAKDKFFSIIAHDLKSPFGSVLMMTEILKENIRKYSTNEVEMNIDSIYKSTEKGFKLLENLLEWSKLQIGKIEYNPSSFNFKDIVDENIQLFNQNAEKKEINLCAGEIENIKLYADQNMINTVLRNLISNAIKFTPRGGFVSVDCKKENDSVQISVTDSGVGIEGDIEKLFKEGNNISTYGTEEEKGTGLGLCLCKELIQKHNGELCVQSEVGKGSCFSFNLPIN